MATTTNTQIEALELELEALATLADLSNGQTEFALETLRTVAAAPSIVTYL